MSGSTPKINKTLSVAAVIDNINVLVSHSFKVINTNAVIGGIRVSDSQIQRLQEKHGIREFISGLSGDLRPRLDYANSSSVSGLSAMTALALVDKLVDGDGVIDHVGAKPGLIAMGTVMQAGEKGKSVEVSYISIAKQDAKSIVMAYQAACESHYDMSSDAVDYKLKQVVLPMNGDYLSLTPLYYAGFSEKLNAVRSANQYKKKVDREDGYRRINTTFMNYGGSNDQNAGRRVGSMKNVFMFDAPQESLDVKSAYKTYYRGAFIALPRDLLCQWYDWRQSQTAAHGNVKTTLHSREMEAQYLKKIVDNINKKIEALSDFQRQHQEKLPLKEVVSKAVASDLIQEGIFTPSLRNHAWKRALAGYIVSRLDSFNLGHDRGVIALSKHERSTILNTIEGLL